MKVYSLEKGTGGSTFVVHPPHVGFEPFPLEIQSSAVFKALLYEAAEKRPRGGTRLSSCPYHLLDDAAKINIKFLICKFLCQKMNILLKCWTR